MSRRREPGSPANRMRASISRSLIRMQLTVLSSLRVLSGVLQCSMRSSITVLKVGARLAYLKSQFLSKTPFQERFLRQLKSTKIPRSRDAAGNITAQYNRAIINTHGAVLGLIAM
jgi:hypothetical protein